MDERRFSETRPASTSPAHRAFNNEVNLRWNNQHAIIENPLDEAYLSDEQLSEDVYRFQTKHLPEVDRDKLLRAARVAKDIRSYDEVARAVDHDAGHDLPVQLTLQEKEALKAERDVLFSEPGMFIVILTVSLAAFLQGFVQSSINGASLFPGQFGLHIDQNHTSHGNETATALIVQANDWKLGAANASPFLSAAIFGCWLSLPINDRMGRRGAMAVAACLILGSSLGSAFCRGWVPLFLVRIVNGIGMGIKAVSTPILASETAVGFWRGSSILAWQLWVALGIFVGFAFNLIFNAGFVNHDTRLGFILGAPLVPALFMLVSLWFCPESPRYYMRRKSPSTFNPSRALAVLRKLRRTELQALRDVYLVYKSVQLEKYADEIDPETHVGPQRRGFFSQLGGYLSQYRDLIKNRRLRNALISSSVVSLAQQICGINVLAFYSGTLFSRANPSSPVRDAMLYSLGYGAVNFLFGLPAIRTIDTLGRRKWLTMTLPLMCLMMLGGALSATLIDKNRNVLRAGVMALFVFLFAAAYSPGLGPIPFTLASESFPLSHREAGCASAIAVNLLFAGLLTLFYPSINRGLGDGGSLGLFAALNLVAFVLVFLLVEETKRRSLEDLDLVFAVRKRDFIRHQVTRYLPWFFTHYVRRRRDGPPKPSLYLDKIWGPQGASSPPEHAGASREMLPWSGVSSPPSPFGPAAPAPPPPEATLARTGSASEDSTHA